MECVSMKRRKRNDLLSLEVPGLAEKRPSLVIGDSIFVKLASEDETSNTPHQVRPKMHMPNIFIRVSFL